jgi:hypothetical protein
VIHFDLAKKMNEPMTDERIGENPLGCFPYVIGVASFIPLIGVPIGLIVIIWGIVKRKVGGLILATVGVCGILFTLILCGMYYKGGRTHDHAEVQIAIFHDRQKDIAHITNCSRL